MGTSTRRSPLSPTSTTPLARLPPLPSPTSTTSLVRFPPWLSPMSTLSPSLPQWLSPPQLLPPPTPLPQLSLTTATPPLPPLTPMADTPMVDTPPSPPGPSTKSATKDTWAYDKLLLWFLFEWKNPGGFSVRKEPRG